MRTATWVCAALSHPCFTGISRQHLGNLIAELADPWPQHEAALTQRRGHERRPKPQLVCCDRVLVTLVVLRFQLPHQALTVLYGLDRSSVTRPTPWSRLGLLAALPVTATAVYGLAGATLASTDRLRALHQALIWSQTAIGWLAFLTALLAARRTGRGGAG